MKRFFGLLVHVVWGIALILILVEMPSHFRIGLLPDRVFYSALAIVAVATWPIIAQLIRARRDGREAARERERGLSSVVDNPFPRSTRGTEETRAVSGRTRHDRE